MLFGLDLFGWMGGMLCAAAYVLVSGRRIAPDGAPFQGLNIVGATLLSVSCFHNGALPSACVNIVWILFGIQSLVVAGNRRRRQIVRHPVAPDFDEDAVNAF